MSLSKHITLGRSAGGDFDATLYINHNEYILEHYLIGN